MTPGLEFRTCFYEIFGRFGFESITVKHSVALFTRHFPFRKQNALVAVHFFSDCRFPEGTKNLSSGSFSQILWSEIVKILHC